MALKVFHTADVHLGMKFSSYHEAKELLTEARFEAFERCVRAANDTKCNLFVVSGDLFERVSIAKTDIVRAAETLSRFEGDCACVLPGNHDYYTPGRDELWSVFRESCGGKVELLTQQREYPLTHYDIDASIFPAPCHAKTSDKNVIGWIKEKASLSDARYRIGVAHGSLEGISPDFDKRYYPMSKDELLSCGVDLWLLGHTHTPHPATREQETVIFYPGTPEPDGFDRTHGGNAWIIDLDEQKKIAFEPVPTGKYRFLHETCALREEGDLDTMKSQFSSGEYEKTLLKLALTGSLPRDLYGTVSGILRDIEDHVFFLHHPVDRSGLREEITAEDIGSEFTEGSFPYRLLMKLTEADDNIALQVAYEIVREASRDR